MSEYTKIGFVGTPDYPIPAVKGGAIQTLVGALIDQNEMIHKYDFTVFTIDDPMIKNHKMKYKFTNIIPIKINIVEKCALIIRKIIRRISRNKIKYKSAYMEKINSYIENHQFDMIIFESTDKEAIQGPSKEDTIMIYHVHSDYLSNSTERIHTLCIKCKYFIAVSEFIKNRLLMIECLNKEQVFVLNNAVDVKKQSEQSVEYDRNAIRMKYGLGKTDKVIIYCGRLSPEKDV